MLKGRALPAQASSQVDVLQVYAHHAFWCGFLFYVYAFGKQDSSRARRMLKTTKKKWGVDFARNHNRTLGAVAR